MSCDSLQLKEGVFYFNGKTFSGKCCTYYSKSETKGTERIKETYNYKNGLRSGYFINYDDSGKITQEGNVSVIHKKTEDGEIAIRMGNGTSYEYYPGGNKKTEIKYNYSEEGMKTELTTVWHESGKVKSITHFNKQGKQYKQETFRENGDKEILLLFEYTENQRNIYFTEYKWDLKGNKTVEKGCYSPKF